MARIRIKGDTEMKKPSRSPLLFAVIAALTIFSLFAIIYAYTNLAPPSEPVDQVTPSNESTNNESYFHVKIAYAYVGSLPPDKTFYIDPTTNATMVHTSKYPSTVFLEFTPVPSMTDSCDAVISLYGVKIVADTGPTEHHGWSAGTANYSTFTQDDFATITSYRAGMIHNSTYRFGGGTFSYNWASDQPVLSHAIGSFGTYTLNSTFTQPSSYDLSSAGTPNEITVEVYRIGYITMTNGSITIHEDTKTDNKPVTSAQLSKYKDGFIHNNIVPTEQLPQTDLFNPPR
jgi:hypothetical protein